MVASRTDTSFHRLLDDMAIPGRWFVRFPAARPGRLLACHLAECERIDRFAPIQLEISRPGRMLDMLSTSDASVPIVSETAARIIQETAGDDVQLLPAHIENVSEAYYYVNVLRKIDCVDRNRSLISDRGRKREILIEPVIDPARAGLARIFRVTSQDIVVRDVLRDAIEAAGLTGPLFIQLKTSNGF